MTVKAACRLGDEIDAERLRRVLTQAAAADEVKITRVSWSNIITGKTRPSLLMLAKLKHWLAWSREQVVPPPKKADE